MEFLGLWKLKEMLTADENGVKRLGRDEILEYSRTEGDEDLEKLLRADFILSEDALTTYYMPTEEEMPLVEEEGWELTEYGVVLDTYPAKIIDGVLLLDYDKEGVEYVPVPIDEDGFIVVSDGLMKLEKVEYIPPTVS